MAEEKKFYIRVPGELVEVSEEVYCAYHQEERRTRTLEEKDLRNGKVLYGDLDTKEISGEEAIPDDDVLSVEDIAVTNVLYGELYRCLSLLSDSDRDIINFLFFDGGTERDYAKICGITQCAVNKRKKLAISRLKKLMKI